MGKCTRKGKLTSDIVAVMDVSQSSLGVRTRATTLALQKIQSVRSTATPPPEQQHELSYLQLRSRKLEKPPLHQSTCYTQQKPSSISRTPRLPIRSCGSVSTGSCSSKGNFRALTEIRIEAEGKSEADRDFGTEETSFGDNYVDSNRRERESTPCSFIQDSNDQTTPGSSTRWIMPSAQEMEEFFARHAQEQQRLFSEKYNFDVANEKPLHGRYEWVKA